MFTFLKKLLSKAFISTLIFLVCFTSTLAPIDNQARADSQAQAMLMATAASTTGIISSVQPVAITIANTTSSNTATITSVNTSLCAVIYNGSTNTNTSGDSGANDIGSLVLTNATTVTATRSGTSGALTLYGTVTCFNSSKIQSIQTGTIALTTTTASNTATITSVTTTNAAVLYNGQTMSTTLTRGNMGYFNLTNGTTVTFTRDVANSATVTGAYTVIEFKSGILNSSTQEKTIAITGGTTTNTTITAITTGQTWIAFGGYSAGSNSNWTADYEPYTTLTSTTNLQTKTTTLNGSGHFIATVVEFKAADIQSVNRAATLINSASNAFTDTTITSVNTAKTFTNWLGATATAGATSNQALWQTSSVLTSATNNRVERNTASSTSTETVSWETIESK